MGSQTHSEWLRDLLSSFYAFPSESVTPEYAAEVEVRLGVIATDLESHDQTIKTLTAERDRLANELRQARSDLVVLHDRNNRGRTGWKIEKEANEAAQRYITILESERDRLLEVLANIAECDDKAAELYTSDKDRADSFADKARTAVLTHQEPVRKVTAYDPWQTAWGCKIDDNGYGSPMLLAEAHSRKEDAAARGGTVVPVLIVEVLRR